MPMSHEIITIDDTTPTIVTIDGDTTPNNLTISIQNLSSNNKEVYLGDSSVSSSSFGFKLPADGTVVFENLRKSTEIYAIAEDGEIDLAIMRFVFS